MLLRYLVGLRWHSGGVGSTFKSLTAPDVGRILIHIDHTRRASVGVAQHFAEKPLGCSGAARFIEQEIKRIALRIHGTIQIQPLTTYLDVRFIDPPGIIRLLQMRPAAFIQFRRMPCTQR